MAVVNIMLSVIIPVYNSEEFLPRAIKSVLGQTFRNLELIVVNDGSAGNCEEIVKSFSKTDDRVRYCMHRENKGPFEARITGSRLATGKFIAFVDSDDYLSRDYYRMLINKAEKSGADIVAGKTIFTKDGRDYVSTIMDNMFSHRDLNGRQIFERFCESRGLMFLWHTLWNKLYRKSLWDACMPWFEKLDRRVLRFEDIALSVPLMHQARKMTFVESEHYHYRRHHESLMGKPRMALEELLKLVQDTAAVFDFIAAYLDVVGAPEEDKKYCGEARRLYYALARERVVPFERSELASDKMEMLETCFKILAQDEVDSNVLNPGFIYQVETDITGFPFQDVKELIAGSDIHCVSFDVYDTLIMRPFFYPTDIFLLLEKKFELLMNCNVTFRDIRIQAEHDARERKIHQGQEEIGLQDIYDQIAVSHDIPLDVAIQLCAEEKRLEIHFSQQRNSAKELFDFAKEIGKRIIIASDMYLDEATMRTILEKNGYAGYERLFVSSECGVSKHSGKLFPYILDEMGISAKHVLHIGDNWTSDYINPTQHGIRAFFFPKATDVFQNRIGTHPTNDCFNIAKKAYGVLGDLNALENSAGYRTALALVANRYFDNPFRPFHRGSDFNADPFLIGYYPVAMHMLGLAKWILERCRKLRYKNIHFVSRDGFLPMAFFNRLAPHFPEAPKADYIHATRRALLPVSLSKNLDFPGLIRLQWFRAQTCPRDIIHLFAFCVKPMRESEMDSRLAQAGFNPASPLGDASEYRRFIRFFLNELYDKKRHAESRELTFDYFCNKVGESDVFFDVGYNGTTASAISELTGRKVNFLYVHNDGDMANDARRRHDFECECLYDFRPAISYLLREHLISESGPTCVGFERVDGEVEPIFTADEKIAQDVLVIEAVHAAALEFIDDFLSMFSDYLEFLPFKPVEMAMPFEGILRLHRDIDMKLFNVAFFEDFQNFGGEKQNIYRFMLHEKQRSDNDFNALWAAPEPLVRRQDGRLRRFLDFTKRSLFDRHILRSTNRPKKQMRKDRSQEKAKSTATANEKIVTDAASRYWICPWYLKEVAVYADGSVVACCQDALGDNLIGNCRDITLDELWKKQTGEWHEANVKASEEGKKWNSKLCFFSCFETNRLVHYGPRNDATQEEFEKFKNQTPPYPQSIVIEPIAVCNYRCHFCASAAGMAPRIRTALSLDMLAERIAPYLKHVGKVRLYDFGEPLLHPEIISIIRIIRDSAPAIEIEISTNGILMTKNISEALVEYQVNRLIVSLHGGHTQELLARFATDTLSGDYAEVERKVAALKHGPNIETVARNIRDLMEIKGRLSKQLPWVCVKTLLGAWNDNSIFMDDFLRWAHELGVDFAGFNVASTNGFNSERFRQGTPLWECVARRKQLELDFHDIFPAWPEEGFAPSVPVGGLPISEQDRAIWYSDQ